MEAESKLEEDKSRMKHLGVMISSDENVKK